MKNKRIIQLERVLIVAVVALLLSIIGLNAKTILQSQQRSVLQSNSKVYNLQSEVSPRGEVVVKIDQMKNYPKLEIFINGLFFQKFGDAKEIKVKVKNGDLLQINGSMYNEDIKLTLSKITGNIKTPNDQEKVITHGNIVVLSTIRIQ